MVYTGTKRSIILIQLPDGLSLK